MSDDRDYAAEYAQLLESDIAEPEYVKRLAVSLNPTEKDLKDLVALFNMAWREFPRRDVRMFYSEVMEHVLLVREALDRKFRHQDALDAVRCMVVADLEMAQYAIDTLRPCRKRSARKGNPEMYDELAREVIAISPELGSCLVDPLCLAFNDSLFLPSEYSDYATISDFIDGLHALTAILKAAERRIGGRSASLFRVAGEQARSAIPAARALYEDRFEYREKPFIGRYLTAHAQFARGVVDAIRGETTYHAVVAS